MIISLLDGATPRAMVFLSHGFSEHLGLYKEIGAFLGRTGINENIRFCRSKMLSTFYYRENIKWRKKVLDFEVSLYALVPECKATTVFQR
jgi:hypothetical protein